MTNELAIRILTGDVLGTTEQTHEAVKMAVKALSSSDFLETNVGDLISRQRAIASAISGRVRIDDGERWIRVSEVRESLINAPSAQPEKCEDCVNFNKARLLIPQPEQKWILVSERLPKLGEKVLVSTKNTVFTQVFKCIYGTPDRWGWEHNSIKKVTAWMPSPKPYKGEKNNDEIHNS